MPCSDYAGVPPDKSVPPKKSHSWRSRNRTSAGHQRPNITLENKDSKPDLPLKMRSSTQSVSQNGNHQGFEKFSPVAGPSEDLPLDFSFKSNSRRCLSETTPSSSQERHSPVVSRGHPFDLLNREQRFFGGADCKPQPSFEANHQQTNRSSSNFYDQRETTVSPQADQNSCSLDMSKSELSNDQYLESSTGWGRNPSYSPRQHSPNSSSPILAGMLSGSSPDVLPTMPVEAMSSSLLALSLQNGYSSGHNSMFLQGGISSSNPVMPSPAIFPPGDIVAPPAMTFIPTPLSMMGSISQVQPPCKAENKVTRKAKQERPFKNYDVSLQDELQWQLPFAPRAIEAPSSPVEAQQPEPRCVPHQNGTNNMNGNSNSLPDSDPPENSELDNVPHSSIPSSSPPKETTDMSKARGRKRKPVAESEKDDSYWVRRKKNNQAAKRSRENRRIKEDTVAQQAIFFRGETSRLSGIIFHLDARLNDLSIKCTRLEQDKLALTAENAMLKQLVGQKRCGQCGNHLSAKLL